MSDYSEDQGFFERIGEFLADHGRTIVSIIVVVLLVGTGIYAYTRDGADNGIEERIEDLANQDDADDEAEKPNENDNSSEGTTNNSSTDQEQSDDISNTNDTVEVPEDTEVVVVNPDTSDITVKAAQGDGVTHLAREAVDRYITDNSIEGIEPGHRVYMETTLKNQYYQESLEVGQEITFTGSDLSQVVKDAQNLNEHQLANWAYYAQYIHAY
jgi:hypothetical protein